MAKTKNKEQHKKDEIVNIEKANYLMTSAGTLITTGSIFVLAFVSALIFLDATNTNLGVITYFLAGTLVVGFIGMISGFEKMFLSMKYAGGVETSVSLARSELLYGVMGLLVALLFIYTLGIDTHTEITPFVVGLAMALLIIFLPRQIVLNERILVLKKSYFIVSFIAVIVLTIFAIASNIILGTNYLAQPYGHIGSILVVAMIVVLISKFSDIKFTKTDSLGLALTVFFVNLIMMFATFFIFTSLGFMKNLPDDYLFRSTMETVISTALAFVLFFSVFSIEER